MTLPDTLKFNGLQVTSLITGVMALVLGIVYFGPEQYVRRDRPPGQTSIVAYVETIAPVWPVLFIAMGVAIILAITSRYGVISAHILAMFGWMFYGTALLVGAALSVPPTPIVTGVVSIGVAGIHFGLIQAHQESGDGPRRRPPTRGDE